MNEPDKESLDRMTPSELHEFREAVASSLTESKQTLSMVDGVINHRFGSAVVDALNVAGKAGGSATFPIDDKVRGKGDISKKVEWDQGKLKAVAQGMAWTEVDHLFDITFKIPEAKFSALMPGELRDRVEASRTVHYGTPKVKLEEVKS